MASSQVPHNKELERTRSPQTALGPRRSIQCCADRATPKPVLQSRFLATFAPLILLLAFTAPTAAQTLSPSVSVAISVPHGDGYPTSIEYREPGSHFHVLVSNIGSKPLSLWQDWNSWGYYSLSFEMEDATGQKWVAKKKQIGFTRNFPAAWLLSPKQTWVVDVYWGDEDTWQGFPARGTERKPLKIRAIFEVRPDKETKQYGVWTGRAESEPVEALFSKWNGSE